MITRLVKMTFKSEHIGDFEQLFNQYKHAIRSSPGCIHLELLKDIEQPQVFFTFSRWETELDLNNYRHSDTFGVVWPRTKAMFSEKPEAWSTQAMEVIK